MESITESGNMTEFCMARQLNNGQDLGFLPLTFKSYFLLVSFLISLIPISLDIKIRRYEIDYCMSALIVTLANLCIGGVSLADLWSGIIGSGHIQPYAIFILFFSLAYLCISVDCSGIFSLIAQTISRSIFRQQSDQDGNKYSLDGEDQDEIMDVIQVKAKLAQYHQFYIVFYLFTAIATLLLSNDVVILTLTPILIKICQINHFDAYPFMILQFVVANTFSMGFYIGNPTNVIVSSALNLSFMQYASIFMVPCLIAGIVVFICSYIRFGLFSALTSGDSGPTIPLSIKRYQEMIIRVKSRYSTSGGPLKYISGDKSRDSLQIDEKWSLIASCSVLGVCLFLLIASSPLRIPLWVITLPSALLALLKDCIYNRFTFRQVDHHPNDSLLIEMSQLQTTEVDDDIVASAPLMNTNTSQRYSLWPFLRLMTRYIPARVRQVAERMPWKIAPFILCMFVLVEALDSQGWLSRMSWLFQELIIDLMQTNGIYSVTVVMSLLASALCVVFNNQPLTVLLTKIFIHPSFVCGLQRLHDAELIQKSFSSAIYSLILGSNLGGNLSINAALAGLLWIKIVSPMLLQHGDAKISPIKFSLDAGLSLTLPAIITSSLFLAAQIS
ncbi:hypothetical protein MIR68_001070 [Amoeboaphelidium protococcarum]|nr:hypothetical protein MIR68_001070 [Amoeboaphelidium protococcarum]